MSVVYWITRNYIDRMINLNFASSRYYNLNAFVNMARNCELRRVLQAIREDSRTRRFFFPGEYLSLMVENGRVEAEITLFEDCDVVVMNAEDFAIILADYLAEWDEMCRALG
jgi:hypothetical protein